ncbi:MAG: hypothetical protein WCL10_02065 [Novosphingobium sp.]|uniref:tetratricopeptide repeat protein n=1 Tax=Novosphingobium sp. TaxID=1874826 RepID=UPI003017D957
MLIFLPVMLAAVLVPPLPAAPVIWHQIGPNPRPMEPSPLPIPRRKRVTEVPPPVPGEAQPATQSATPASAPVRSRKGTCLTAYSDPAEAIRATRALLAATPAAPANAARGSAAHCLGVLLFDSGDYAGAQGAFAESAAQVPATDIAARAALQAMAGTAALAAGKAEDALAWFDKALADPPSKAPTAAENADRGAVQIDRSRALVALNRLPEASGALEEAHRLAPNDPEGWLLSATLGRRGKDLERAQRDIEVAAGLAAHGDPLGAQIGLEAGVIAMLDGREEAARKSWDSVIALAPASPEALTAKGYLDQLGPAPAAAPAPAPATATAPESPR